MMLLETDGSCDCVDAGLSLLMRLMFSLTIDGLRFMDIRRLEFVHRYDERWLTD
jgi:hypothetical protein